MFRKTELTVGSTAHPTEDGALPVDAKGRDEIGASLIAVEAKEEMARVFASSTGYTNGTLVLDF